MVLCVCERKSVLDGWKIDGMICSHVCEASEKEYAFYCDGDRLDFGCNLGIISSFPGAPVSSS